MKVRKFPYWTRVIKTNYSSDTFLPAVLKENLNYFDVPKKKVKTKKPIEYFCVSNYKKLTIFKFD